MASDERRSRSSGRAPTTTKSGTPLPHWIRCSTRSRSSGSAHCRSSMTSTTGFSFARARRKRRMTKKVSSGDAGEPASRALMPATMRARSTIAEASAGGSVDESAVKAASMAARTPSPASPTSPGPSFARRGLPPSHSRNASAIGANVAPPAASQWAAISCALSARRRPTSSIRRDLPRPGEPSSTARRAAGLSRAVSYTAVRRASSSARPTNAAVVPVGRSSDSTRYAVTVSARPLSANVPARSKVTASATSRRVACPISTWPSRASCCRRAATLSGSPMPAGCSSLTTTSPVFTATRRPIDTVSDCCDCTNSRNASWIPTAARTARRASSSAIRGMPKAHSTPSPSNCTTVPPAASTGTRTAW